MGFYKNPSSIVGEAVAEVRSGMVRISNIMNNEYGHVGKPCAVLSEMYKLLFDATRKYQDYLESLK